MRELKERNGSAADTQGTSITQSASHLISPLLIDFKKDYVPVQLSSVPSVPLVLKSELKSGGCTAIF